MRRLFFHAWETATGIRLMDGIGSTDMLHTFIDSSAEDAKPGSTGTVVPGFRARVVDDDGTDVPVATVGRLAVSGPTGCHDLGDIANQRVVVQRVIEPGARVEIAATAMVSS